MNGFAGWGSQAFIEGADRSLCLYVHIPFCHHRCSFCPFYINRTSADFSREYAQWVDLDIRLTACEIGECRRSRAVDAIYFGGGTPSDMEPHDLAGLLKQLRREFYLTEQTEITVEGRVRGFSEEKASAWVAAGANRFSLGIQTTNTALRRQLGRLADLEEIRRTLCGIANTGALVIADLIYGLPGQSTATLIEDISFLATETPLHGLDLYQLRMFEGAPLMQAIEAGRLANLPAPPSCRIMLEAAEKALLDHGFECFSPRHWRRDLRERSLYNQLSRGGNADILPFGSAAGGRLGRHSLSNSRDYQAYQEVLCERNREIAAVIGLAAFPDSR